MRKFLCLLVLLTIPTVPGLVLAQQATPQSVSSNAYANSVPTANQGVVTSLSSLPEADVLIYINPQRILNDVAPKFMSVSDVAEMKKGFEEVRRNFGVDPAMVEYIVMAVRFKKPTTDLQFQPPEAMIIAGGDISSESLMSLARMASQGQLRDETYGGKTIGLMTIDPLVKEAEKNPFLRNFTEVGIASLSGNSIAVGTPGYLRAAIDAADGKGRISQEALSSLMRDTSALISVAGRPWNSFARSFGMMGTEANERTPRCDMKIGDFYAQVTMDASNFRLRAAANEDNPDTAKIVSNMFSTILGYASSSMNDPSIQAMLKRLVIAAEGDELTVKADFPQQMVVDMVKQQMMKPKQEATVSAPAATTKSTAKPAPPRRRLRRRSTRP